MGLKKGAGDVALRVGGSAVTRAYRGAAQVFSSTPATWQQAWDSTNLATLKTWFDTNTGPRVAIDAANPIVGPITVATQADADALVGKLVQGTVNWTASNVTLQDCKIETTGRCINFQDPGTDPAGNTIQFVELDGLNGQTSTGVGGISYFKANLNNVKIRRCGGDSARWGMSGCIYTHVYVTEVRAWNAAVDGTYDPNVHPHTDGIQAVRGAGHRLLKSWVDLGVKDANDTGALLIKGDSAAISDMSIEDCYLNGGHYTAYVHDSTGTADAQFLRNRFGRDFGDGLWSFLPTTKTIPRTDNVWADTLAAVPLTQGPIAK